MSIIVQKEIDILIDERQHITNSQNQARKNVTKLQKLAPKIDAQIQGPPLKTPSQKTPPEELAYVIPLLEAEINTTRIIEQEIALRHTQIEKIRKKEQQTMFILAGIVIVVALALIVWFLSVINVI